MRLKIPPTVVRLVGAPLVRLLARTWRIELAHPERWERVWSDGTPLVVLCWHETLLPLVWHHRGHPVALVVSEARDGQYLADFSAELGYRLIRGSSTRGAARALLNAVRELEAGRAVAFTPDGPRGPRRVMKPGALAAAQRAGATVLPVYAETDRAWRLHSWDRFVIPKPWARIRIAYGQAFRVAPGEEGLARAVTCATTGLEKMSGART